jgi:hypothetical protein
MTMRQLWLALLLCGAARLAAQQPDSGMQDDSARLETLRQEVQQRYKARAHEVLGLTPAQATKFDSTQDRAWGQRRDLMLQRRRINFALQDQMRPGVAARSDSVSRLLDARQRVNESLRRVDDQEDREMAGYLTPVQRARYQSFRGHVRERMGEAMRHQQGGGGGRMRDGARPRPRAQGRPPRRRP